MRVFQNIGLYPAYLPKIQTKWQSCESFADMIRELLEDRFNGVHHLKPVTEYDESCFFTSGDNVQLQSRWAKENGLSDRTHLQEILLSQIEDHRTEVFYNLDPVRYGDEFLKRIPGCVKRTVAWRAAPSGNAKFLDHDLIVNNYPSLAKQYEKQGAQTGYLFPSHDPLMDKYAENEDRPIDILFIGGYSRHHLERAAILEAVSKLGKNYNVILHLDVSRATALSETPLGWIGPLKKLRRPHTVKKLSRPPVFGLDMYRQISRAKIVINGKVDIAGNDRGNMRLWETLGCGALLLTDDGKYPRQMTPGEHFVTYQNSVHLMEQLDTLLSNPNRCKEIAKSGYDMIKTKFSKEVQWKAFQDLCA